MNRSERAADVLAVAEGAKHWSVLAGVSGLPGMWFFEPQDPVAVPLSALATGLLRLRIDPRALHEWASFVLAASSVMDLGTFEEIENGAVFYDCIWDLGFGAPVSAEMIRVATSFLNER